MLDINLKEIPNSILHSVLSRMEQYKIPATPENYTIWYEYCRGVRSDIKLQLDKLIDAESDFDEQVNQELYRSFFEEGQKNLLHKIHHAITKLINKINGEYKRYEQELGHYESSLMVCEQQLDPGTDVVTLQKLVGKLIEDTRLAKNVTRDAGCSIRNMTTKINDLRLEVDQLSEQALTDFLTGIGNRRAFDTRFNDLLSDSVKGCKSVESSKQFSLLMMDIDNFQKFNDDHGHGNGDLILRFVAKLLKNSIKGRDLAVRYGGEEFAILLPGTGHDGAFSVADSILNSIGRKKLKVGKNKLAVGNITVSIGVATFREGDNNETMLERADLCLYTAKHRGRNRVVTDLQMMQ